MISYTPIYASQVYLRVTLLVQEGRSFEKERHLHILQVVKFKVLHRVDMECIDQFRMMWICCGYSLEKKQDEFNMEER